jgi:hypothetical protein
MPRWPPKKPDSRHTEKTGSLPVFWFARKNLKQAPTPMHMGGISDRSTDRQSIATSAHYQRKPCNRRNKRKHKKTAWAGGFFVQMRR